MKREADSKSKKAASSKNEEVTKGKEVSKVWTSDNPKYKYGDALLDNNELTVLGGPILALQNFYSRSSRSGIKGITLLVNSSHFHIEADSYIAVDFADLYDIFNISALDMSLMRCFTL